MSPTNQQIEVVANFYDDWIEILRAELAKHGHPTGPEDSPEQIHRRYHNLLKRLISITPRRTHTARELKCPVKYRGAVNDIIRKATRGENLNPYQSKLIAKDAGFNDLALNQWGVHHLHLGSTLEPDSGFIERTGPLLFARITDSDFYLIGIFKHKSDWGNRRILEIIHANWPESIEHFRLIGISGLATPPTSEDYLRAQKRHFNLPLQLADGTVYFPFGTGIGAVGLSPDIVMRVDMEADRIRRLEQIARDNAPLFVAKAREHGHSIGPALHLKLTFDANNDPLAHDMISGVKFRISIDSQAP